MIFVIIFQDISHCKFFIWKEDMDNTLSLEKAKLMSLKNHALEMKISNLEVEKMILEEENKSLKLKLSKSKGNYPIQIYVVVFIVGLVFIYYCK
jgi:hypothetical protein